VEARTAKRARIAEYVLAAVLTFEKRLNDAWIDAPPAQQFGPLGAELWTTDNELSGKVLGIVGLGAIGQRIATLANAFGMKVVAVRRHPGRGAPAGVKLVGSAAELWPVVDHLGFCSALTAETRHIMDAGRSNTANRECTSSMWDGVVSSTTRRCSTGWIRAELPARLSMWWTPSRYRQAIRCTPIRGHG
jgi:phosphoglycerate dehydrogenase-like enzyme